MDMQIMDGQEASHEVPKYFVILCSTDEVHLAQFHHSFILARDAASCLRREREVET